MSVILSVVFVVRSTVEELTVDCVVLTFSVVGDVSSVVRVVVYVCGSVFIERVVLLVVKEESLVVSVTNDFVDVSPPSVVVSVVVVVFNGVSGDVG